MAVPLRMSCTSACMPPAFPNAIWLLGLPLQASERAPTAWSWTFSSGLWSMLTSTFIPPAARKMGGGLRLPPRGFHCWCMGSTSGASGGTAAMPVDITMPGLGIAGPSICGESSGTRGAGISLPPMRARFSGGGCTATGNPAGCWAMGWAKPPVCWGMGLARPARFWFTPVAGPGRAATMAHHVFCTDSNWLTRVLVSGRSVAQWAQHSCMSWTKPTGALCRCAGSTAGRPGGGRTVSLLFCVTCWMICTMSIPFHGIAPVSTSHMTSPTLYTSMRIPCGWLSITSGAMYCGVPAMVLVPGRTERASRTFERPKSATLTRWSCETSRFNGLKSPWMRPALWMARRPYRESRR
mmetsp:Transcript_46451/g.109121  ORF Transcript_46451/g.109121 Transcript_46451/m.109121 type:complete len:352 (+) Transcript_46451:1743-2798(+)